jgi:hypothetical protein
MRPKYPFNPADAFDALRSVIYCAALERVRLGSSMTQHVITAHELRAIEDTAPVTVPNRRQPNAGVGEEA